MFKFFITIILMVVSISLSAQSLTQKWNDFYNRYDIFDRNGKLKGYYKYSELYKRWEYFDN